MVGQGRPQTSQPPRASPCTSRQTFSTWWVLYWALIAALASSALAASARAAESTMRLRIAWGGGAERQWKGTVSVSEGELAEAQALGVEADEPGSIWLADGQLHVRERSPRAYNGVDVLVHADLDAHLSVALTPLGAEDASPLEIRLADLVADSYSSQLDTQGNRLLVVRSPGDKLRVQFERGSLVFAPGETFSLEIQPHLLGLAAGSALRISGQLTAAGSGARLWSGDFEAVSNEPGSPGKPYSLTLKLPDAEGVYDLTFTAAGAKQRQRLPWKKPIVERKVQLVVVDSKPPAVETAALGKLTEIDPVNPHWWERLGNIPLWPGERKGPLGNGEASRWEHPQLGPFIQLGPAAHGGKASWEAYPLPLNQPGQPHVLEVEYPSNVPQALGLSILEPNAAGAVMPIGLDSGVYVADDEADSAPQVLKHRLVFWPRTKSPLLLVTNRRENAPALYGKIRVLGASIGLTARPLGRAAPNGPTQLPRAFAQEPGGERLLAGYYDRPLIAENFSASEALDAFSHRSLDDWTTFYQAGSRLVEYLSYVGYNGLMLSVAADGSGLYPSQTLEPTPRHDTGTFFASGQDPLRKDVLELLFRLFDRQKMRLIPVVHFTGPLPELETLRRQDATDDGLNWIGSDGVAWSDRQRDRSDQVPPYNPLDPRVQQAMLNVVKELSARYGEHASFGGVALRLSADGYAQLPTADGGYDDDTMRRLQHDTHLDIPGEGATRFAARARFLNGPGKNTWYVWRANQLAALHQRMQQEIAAARPEAHLYLAAATLLEHRQVQRSLRPGLPRRTKVEEVLLALGIRPEAYRSDERIVLLRPQEISPTSSLLAQGIELEVNPAPEVDRLFSLHQHSGSLFYHEPQRARVPSFDAKSPFGASSTFTALASEFSPSADRNRRRFVHSLATLDAEQMFDGGWLLPLGQEAALTDLVSVYRQLPAGRFDTLAEESQPVTIRALARGGQTYVYLANDSPWPVSVALEVDAPPTMRMEKLGTGSGVGPITRTGDAATWTVKLKPYDLAAARLTSGDVRFHSPKLTLPPQVNASLERRIRDLSARIAALSAAAPLSLLENPGFESPPESGAVAGWTLAAGTGQLELQDRNPHSGGNALSFKNKGSGTAPAVLRSHAFAAPATGRLSVGLWLRTADRARQPAVRVAIEARLADGEYFRYASLGAGTTGAQLTEQWAQYIFQVDDLPADAGAEVRLRVDLLGAGEIWLDDVDLYDLAFAENERVELTKIVSLASYKLQAGQLADCARILDGYWPQFLLANVPLVQKPLPVAQRTKSDAAPPREPPKKGRLEQIRGYLPKWPQF